MTGSIFTIAFLLGAAAVVLMGANFVESNTLALAVTAVIGGVYAIGFIELLQFRRATGTLDRALASLSDATAERLDALDDWLTELHPSLYSPVRMRIEGERVALPAPVLTTYLVSLLVMLGLLGTFVGLVETLKGVVVALEGSSELEAIRQALTAPMGGLGLAFGTSVAGVAASAMLGLMSTLSRRDRLLSSHRLDRLTASALYRFSKDHEQRETFKALQAQSRSLPHIADRLEALTGHIERMSGQLGQQLLSNQERFHESARARYGELAASVERSLHESAARSEQVLAESGRLVGEGIRPIMYEAMSTIGAEIRDGVQDTHRQLNRTVEDQLQALSGRLAQTSEEIATAWRESLEKPMTRLIEVASETPRAAAEVIGRLREEISNNIERDNRLLEERSRLMAQLNEVSDALARSSAGQMSAMRELVDASAETLRHTAGQFTGQVSSEVAQVSEIADHFSAATAEIASLGEAFKVAMELYSESNGRLIDGLERIESALAQSNARSDEQLGYYVAQAREVIDYSVSAQKEIFDTVHRLGHQAADAQPTAEVN